MNIKQTNNPRGLQDKWIMLAITVSPIFLMSMVLEFGHTYCGVSVLDRAPLGNPLGERGSQRGGEKRKSHGVIWEGRYVSNRQRNQGTMFDSCVSAPPLINGTLSSHSLRGSPQGSV